jgi:hypothetical protein
MSSVVQGETADFLDPSISGSISQHQQVSSRLQPLCETEIIVSGRCRKDRGFYSAN